MNNMTNQIEMQCVSFLPWANKFALLLRRSDMNNMTCLDRNAVFFISVVGQQVCPFVEALRYE